MPDISWKRPKELPSTTTEIETPGCGNIKLTIVTEDDKVIEVRCVIGKQPTCPGILMDSFAKILSCYLQSDFPRFRIVKKLRAFLPDSKGNRITCAQNAKGPSCIESVIASIIDHIE